jgi:hypothetical protein
MYELLDDRLLLSRVQLGDKEAYNHLFKKYWSQAYAGAYKRLKDMDQAQDVVQEVFVHVWLKRETPIHNFPAYLNIAVRNQVLKWPYNKSKIHPFWIPYMICRLTTMGQTLIFAGKNSVMRMKHGNWPATEAATDLLTQIF